MGIIIKNKGFLSTIQDLGREGFQQFGVPVSGVMDRRSAKLANILVANPEAEGVLEMLLLGAEILFTKDNIIALTGADLSPKINDKSIKTYCATPVKAGDVLSFGGVKYGSYCYLAVAGGFDVPLVMGSKSTYIKANLGGYKGRRLENHDEIAFSAPKTYIQNLHRRFLTPEVFSQDTSTLRVILGPQEDHFTKEGIHTFLSGAYTVTNEFDRMGCRLEGSAIQHIADGNIISDGIAFGAVQVPSHGQPIVMLADRQTIGGYAKIANIISIDIPKLVQKSAGGKICFKAVTIEEAQSLYLSELKEFEEIKSRFLANSREFKAKVNGREYDISIEEL